MQRVVDAISTGPMRLFRNLLERDGIVPCRAHPVVLPGSIMPRNPISPHSSPDALEVGLLTHSAAAFDLRVRELAASFDLGLFSVSGGGPGHVSSTY